MGGTIESMLCGDSGVMDNVCILRRIWIGYRQRAREEVTRQKQEAKV